MDLHKMAADIAELKKLSLTQDYQSDQLNELAGALAKAQGEMEAAINSSTNPFFKSKYASFADIVRASRPALSKHGLAVTQRIMLDTHQRILSTTLLHASGQWMSSVMPINPPKDDAQSLGSYITYMKRYAYAALVGVYTDDEDDDGSAATQNNNKNTSQQPALRTANKTYERITTEQAQAIMFEIGKYTEVGEMLMKNFGVQKIGDLPKDYYVKIIEGIRKNVAARKESEQ